MDFKVDSEEVAVGKDLQEVVAKDLEEVMVVAKGDSEAAVDVVVAVDVVAAVDVVVGESVPPTTDKVLKVALAINTVHISKGDKSVVNKTLALDQEFKKDL
jgi:hypothetical protein